MSQRRERLMHYTRKQLVDKFLRAEEHRIEATRIMAVERRVNEAALLRERARRLDAERQLDALLDMCERGK